MRDSSRPAQHRFRSFLRNPKRAGSKLWSVTTVSNIVRQSAYSGIHKVRANGGKNIIEQPVPPILDEPGLQERAETTLRQNKRYPNRKNDRDYLLSGLIKCAHCGGAVAGHPTGSRGKKYHYCVCRAGRTRALNNGVPHETSYVNAVWLVLSKASCRKSGSKQRSPTVLRPGSTHCKGVWRTSKMAPRSPFEPAVSS
jgi:hypothetical protein